MKKKTGFRVMLFVLSVLFTVMVLGAKGCEVNTKADILEAIPEILEIAPGLTIDPGKFDVRIYNNLIVLMTYDNMSFLEAVKKLKNETPMNKAIHISMPFYGERIGSEGEFRTEHTVDEIIPFITGERLRPYIGIIRIRDGWWTAMEFDAALLFTNGEINADDEVLVTEYAYANETVYNLNGFTSRYGMKSHFDRTPTNRTVQGDGSMPNDIISEFDRR